MAKKTSATPASAGMDPTRLTVEQLAQVLEKAGAKEVTTDRIRADLAAGAPSQGRGLVHLAQYLAWLVQQTKG